MSILFIFMDGVGLGEGNPHINPFVRASLPNLDRLLDGRKLVANNSQAVYQTKFASLLALDACLGTEGSPQSATGQASLLTGKNVPVILGFHDGPKPNPQVMEILKNGTLFSFLIYEKRNASLLNAYPPRYFDAIESGHRLPGVIAQSAMYADLHLRTKDDLYKGEAISVDFTAQGWHDNLGLIETPLLTFAQAGERMVNLSIGYDLAFFEYWLSDVAGHRREMSAACSLLNSFDMVLGSMVGSWDDAEGLILITSDHGNIEDLSTRHHTRNDVPLLIIGEQALRDKFIQHLHLNRGMRQKPDLTDITPAILGFLEISK